MSIAGVLLVVLYIVLIVKKSINEIAFCFFVLTVCVSLFVNVGVAILGLSYVHLAMYIMLVFSLFYLIHKNAVRRVKKRFIFSASFMLLCILIGDFHLIVSTNNPQVIPFTTTMDAVYHSEIGTSTASFSDSNLIYLRWLFIFIVLVYFSMILLDTDEKKARFLLQIKKVFEAFFLIWTLEWIINNVISPSLIRDIIYSVFGINDVSKTYNVIVRWEFYGFNGLFTEPAYITVMIVYYCILWKFRLETWKDWLLWGWSIVVLFINGSTSGAMLIPFGILIFFKNISKKIKRRTFIIVSLIIALGIGFAFRFQENISQILEKLSTILNAYIFGGYFQSREETSAAIRQFGNDVAYDAFWQRPLFGVGFGTTRGYGILPGALACLGIVGLFSYIFFLGSAYKCKVNRDNVILFAIIAIYSSTILSVWYLYYPLVIPICICMTFEKN